MSRVAENTENGQHAVGMPYQGGGSYTTSRAGLDRPLVHSKRERLGRAWLKWRDVPRDTGPT